MTFENIDNARKRLEAACETREIKEVEAALVRLVLEENGWNKSAACRTLGVNRTTLYNKIRAYGIAKWPSAKATRT